MHKFAINFWSQARVFQKTWLIKIFLDLHSIDSYKKSNDLHIHPFHELYELHKEKVNSCNWFAGITPKKRQKDREIKFIIKHVEIAMTELTSCSAVLGRTKCD